MKAKPVFDLSSLNGSNGFRLDGENEFDGSGASVSSAGDVNGDGYDDVIIGTDFYSSVFPNNEFKLSSSYVVFGKATGFDAQVDLSSLDGSNGFRLDRATTKDSAGFSVSEAGDVNGDGFDDVIVGVLRPDFSGEQYVVFGKASGFDAHIDLSSMDGSNGFRLDGGSEFDLVGLDGLGMPVDNAGDINGDGFDDVIARADKTNSVFGVGSNFVIFGKASGFNATLSLSSLDGSTGFQIEGDSLNDGAAFVVNSAGDVNGDGFDDLIIGSSNVNLNPDFPGSNYVVFGKASGFDAQLDLSNLDGSNGFRVDGENSADTRAYSVSSAGDINGDGFDDVVIGANGVNQDGQLIDTHYVIFGKASGFDARINLSELDGRNGFRLNGNVNLGYSSYAASSSAGDINGDGFDDLIVDSSASGTLDTFSGTSYVVFGKASGFDAQIDLTSLEDKNVLRLFGEVDESNSFSFSVSGAGDVNGDGFDDVIIGAPGSDPNGESSGSSYIVFGRSSFIDDGVIRGTPGDDILTGTPAAERFEAGDGNDRMIGRGGSDVFLGEAGDDYIRVSDLSFESVDGGIGNDSLALGGNGLNLNLTDMAGKISGIETINLFGTGDHTLTLTAADVLNLSDTTNTLKVNGNAGDRIVGLSHGWGDGGVHDGFHTFFNDAAVLLVGVNVATDFV
nr:integrin alpha [Nitrosomonas sp. Nm166]